MTLYHFDISHDGAVWSDDDSGTELPNDDEARDEAIDLAHSLAKARPSASQTAVRVRNGKPEPLVIVTVSTEVQNRALNAGVGFL